MSTKKTILFLFLTTTLCTVSYYFIDRQVVWWLVAHHSRGLFGLKFMANDISDAIGAFVVLFFIYVGIRFGSSSLSKIDVKLLVMCNSIAIAIFLKNMVKPILGRYATSTFICNNPSLVDNHVYGFNWFSHGNAFNSFPSGHATLIFSFSASMWFLFPALRWLWSMLAAMVVIGQLGMYYHFLSDILAGAALGSLVAIYNYHYWTRKAVA